MLTLVLIHIDHEADCLRCGASDDGRLDDSIMADDPVSHSWRIPGEIGLRIIR
jgi:hypothetical protein